MQIEKLPRQINPRRQNQRRSVKPRRRTPAKSSRLKYGNILSLTAAAIAIAWIVTIPFRSHRVAEPPIVSQPPTISPLPVQGTSNPPSNQSDRTFSYNVKIPPNQIYSQELQVIVDELVNIATSKKLPTASLSITLIDVSNSNAHTFAGYQNQTPRFPASVAKLFWMAGFYGALEKGLIQKDESSFTSDLKQMIQVSNNDAASRILDTITDTESGGELSGQKLQTWLKKRQQINAFFQAAGYEGIKLTTKNYPIYYLGQEGPKGRELQLRSNSPKPIRNQVTTDQAARLLYEIYTRQAVSPLASRKMAYLLTRDLNPKAWKNDPSNSIKGFLGESLPTKIYFGSKVGYTSGSRQEAAFIRTLDDRAIYILVIFADDPAYARNETIFPQMSRHVFERLNARGPK
ncbi:MULTISPECIES: serine hydrolase [Kamptonema]|uniref:serine hydrolase n=1 Tax=Kamptonema TaxID=1501433 RepID=UPI0001DAC295|nr:MULTISPECIES: serine hydrolase [Kamptonema]CBN56046.1 conserved exported hypothetical protein [Kamptonema sp. PCC 6506]